MSNKQNTDKPFFFIIEKTPNKMCIFDVKDSNLRKYSLDWESTIGINNKCLDYVKNNKALRVNGYYNDLSRYGLVAYIIPENFFLTEKDQVSWQYGFLIFKSERRLAKVSTYNWSLKTFERVLGLFKGLSKERMNELVAQFALMN